MEGSVCFWIEVHVVSSEEYVFLNEVYVLLGEVYVFNECKMFWEKCLDVCA